MLPRIKWYKEELIRLTEDLHGDCDTILYTKNKIMKLLILIDSEIEYGGTDVSLHRYEYVDMKLSIKDVIDDIVEKECLRRSRDEESLRVKYINAIRTIRNHNIKKGQSKNKYSFELPDV